MKIHFIGIGGIGVSALAKYYLEKGYQITGSDLVSSEITDALKKMGAKIIIGHKSSNLKIQISKPQLKSQNFLLPELVIFSPVIQPDNPELKLAKKMKIQCLSYPQALGKLTKQHFTIAVSGTHGKSTTCAMIGLLLTKAGFDPTIIVGTKLKEFGNANCRVGKSKYLVIEADEHFASFLNYWPKIIVLTRLEADHLDYFKNFKNYTSAFKKFICHLPKDGVLILNKDDKIFHNKTFSTIVKNTRYYSLEQKEAKKLKKILKIPGEHNVSNALAALITARALKIPDKISFKALSEYQGAWRRFEKNPCFIKKGKKIIKFEVISDYAHHPTEIKTTLKAAREKYPKKEIWLIYQPHQYQRTYYLFKDFVKVFREAPIDRLIITDIYEVAGREKKEIKEKIDSKKLVKKITENTLLCNKILSNERVIYLPGSLNFKKIKNYLKENLRGREVAIIMGAGDIYNLTKILRQ